MNQSATKQNQRVTNRQFIQAQHKLEDPKF